MFAGAFTIGALTLILAVQGAGIGLASVSSWISDVAQASRVSAGEIVWLVLAQLVASSIDGYLAGRLRTKWVPLHTHEIYFRDTVHGFLAWAFALSTLFFMSYATLIAARPSAVSMENGLGNYFVDILFRTDPPAAARTDQPLRNDAGLILANALRHPDTTKQDRAYLANLVVTARGRT